MCILTIIKNYEIIKLSKKFENQINSRSSLSSIFSTIENHSTLSIDFQDIDFIYRAVAHELLLNISDLSSKGINVNFIDLNVEIDTLLNNVSLSRKSNVKRATFVQRKTFRSEKDFDNYILRI